MGESEKPGQAYRAYADPRLAAIRDDISTRLWRINAGMSSVRFNALIDNMALVQFDGERRVQVGDRRFALRIDDEPRRS